MRWSPQIAPDRPHPPSGALPHACQTHRAKKSAPSVGDPQPPPLWAAPHRPLRGRRPTASVVGGGLTKWTLLGNPPRGQKDGLPCKHFADEHPRHGRRAHGRGQRAHDGQARERRDCERPFKRCRAHGFRSVERLQGPEAQGCKIPAGQCRVCFHCHGAHWKRRADADGRVRHHASDRPCWSGGLSQERTRASARCVVSTFLLLLLTSPGRSCSLCPSLCRRRTTRTTMWTRTARPTMTRTTSPSSTHAARAPTTST